MLNRLNLTRLLRSKGLKYVALIVVATVLVLVGFKLIKGSRSNVDKVEIASAKAEQQINREFKFPLKNEEGEEISQIKFVVEKAELRDEIVVKGQRATSVKGRTFLIVNLRITNDYDKSIEIDTRDYVRLVVNSNEEEKLAPDIHNDPVEVQAISTKITRVGFPINDNEKNLTLLVGELNGDKERIELKLK